MAMNSHRNLGLVANQQARASRNLSSGFRINSAADDAAGLAISEGMRSQIRGMNQASRNAQDGISLIQTAEGYMQTITELAQRMRVLSVQASNDSNSPEQRAFIAGEMGQLQAEIERIWDTATFNGQAIFASPDSEFSAAAIALVRAAADTGGPLAAPLNTLANQEAATATATNVLVNIMQNRADIQAFNTAFPNTAAGLTNFAASLRDVVEGVNAGFTGEIGSAAHNTAINNAINSHFGITGSALNMTAAQIGAFVGGAELDAGTVGQAGALGNILDSVIASKGFTNSAGALITNRADLATAAGATHFDTNITEATNAITTISANASAARNTIENWIATQHGGDEDHALYGKTVEDVQAIMAGPGAPGAGVAGGTMNPALHSFINNAINNTALGSLLNTVDTATNAAAVAQAAVDGVIADTVAASALHAQLTDAALTTLIRDAVGAIQTELLAISSDAERAAAANTAINNALQAQFGVAGNFALATLTPDQVLGATGLVNGTAANILAVTGVQGAVDAFRNTAVANLGITGVTTWANIDDTGTFDAPALEAALDAAVGNLVTAQTNLATARGAVQTWIDAQDFPAGSPPVTVDDILGVRDGTLGPAGQATENNVGILRGNFFLQVGPDGSPAGNGHSLQVAGEGGQIGTVIEDVSSKVEVLRNELGGSRGEFLVGSQAELTNHETFAAFTNTVDAFIGDVNAMRAGLGAIENRLEFTIENLDIAAENLSAAESRVRDADMAQEMMRLTQANVLQQAATAMLAQANQAPQNVLQLLG